MTYNVFSGTLNLTQLQHLAGAAAEMFCLAVISSAVL